MRTPEQSMGSFDIVLQTETSLHAHGEPSDFISEYVGLIRYQKDSGGKVLKVGKLHAYRINAALAADHGEPLFDVCDAHSHEMHFCHTLLYEPGGYTFQEQIVERFFAIWTDCLGIDL